MEDHPDLSLKLAQWYASNRREMPWRKTKDPYVIWLSEVILQQTQVAQGTPYFNKFLALYPNVKALAESSEQKVLKHWQGLGYYSRARNMLETARYVYTHLNGHFPKNFDGLLKLKGVGEYTAAAIASIAYNEPNAVVDGNVIRVISRIFKIENAFDTAEGKRKIRKLAHDLLDKTNPGQHNQAMMELGSLVCKPQKPVCQLCPVEEYCLAKKNNTVTLYPIRSKKTVTMNRYFNFYVPLLGHRRSLLVKRTSDDIWKNMYTFPMYESGEPLDVAELLWIAKENFRLDTTEVITHIRIRHVLTHRIIYASFYVMRIKEVSKYEKNNIFEVDIESLKTEYSLPRLITKFLENKEVSAFFD